MAAMIEGISLADIINNVTGIGLLGVIAYYLFNRSNKQEDEITKLRNEREKHLKEELDTYKTDFKDILNEMRDGIKKISDKME